MSRRDRLSEELRHQVSVILQRDIHDTRIGFVTITKVDVSPDLKSADIFFTNIENSGDSFKVLKDSVDFIRSLLGKRMRIRYVPRITFINDDSNQARNRVDEILDIIHKQKETTDGD